MGWWGICETRRADNSASGSADVGARVWRSTGRANRGLKWGRAGLGQERLAKRLSVKIERLADWERTGSITMRQAENLAPKTYTPLGYLYLPVAGYRVFDTRALS